MLPETKLAILRYPTLKREVGVKNTTFRCLSIIFFLHMTQSNLNDDALCACEPTEIRFLLVLQGQHIILTILSVIVQNSLMQKVFIHQQPIKNPFAIKLLKW